MSATKSTTHLQRYKRQRLYPFPHTLSSLDDLSISPSVSFSISLDHCPFSSIVRHGRIQTPHGRPGDTSCRRRLPRQASSRSMCACVSSLVRVLHAAALEFNRAGRDRFPGFSMQIPTPGTNDPTWSISRDSVELALRPYPLANIIIARGKHGPVVRGSC